MSALVKLNDAIQRTKAARVLAIRPFTKGRDFGLRIPQLSTGIQTNGIWDAFRELKWP